MCGVAADVQHEKLTEISVASSNVLLTKDASIGTRAADSRFSRCKPCANLRFGGESPLPHQHIKFF